MRPNLSLETFAGALAVLGTGVIMAACGGDAKPPVNATDVPAATDKAAAGDSHCGAGASHKTGDAQCSAAGKAATTSAAAGDTTGAMATPATTSTAGAQAAPAAPAAGAGEKTLSGGATPAPAGTTKKPTTGGAQPAPAAVPGKKGGSSSCGAGTCSAKK